MIAPITRDSRRLFAHLRSGRRLHHARRQDRHSPRSLPRKPHLGGLVDAGRAAAVLVLVAIGEHHPARSKAQLALFCRLRRVSVLCWPELEAAIGKLDGKLAAAQQPASCGSSTGRTSGTALLPPPWRTADALWDGSRRAAEGAGRGCSGAPITSLLSRILSIGQQMRRGCGVSFHQQRT